MFDEKKVFDRDAELDDFRSLVLDTTGGRLLAFHAAASAGKTELLRRLHFEAKQRIKIAKRPVPTVLVTIPERVSHHSLVDQIAKKMGAEGLSTAAYDRASAALLGNVNVYAPQVIEHANAGTISGPDIHVNAEWSPDAQLVARDRMTSSVIDDLRDAGARKTVVLMIDQLELAAPETADWLRQLLTTVIFGDGSEHQGLIVVLAAAAGGGPIQADELEAIAGPAQLDQRCRIRRRLSRFERTHIEQLAASRTTAPIPEATLELIETNVRELNLTVGVIIELLKCYEGER